MSKEAKKTVFNTDKRSGKVQNFQQHPVKLASHKQRTTNFDGHKKSSTDYKRLITKQDALYFQRLKYKVHALYKEMEILSSSTR